MSLDELIQAANQLDSAELDRLIKQVVILRAHRKANVLPLEEAELLHKINLSVSFCTDAYFTPGSKDLLQNSFGRRFTCHS